MAGFGKGIGDFLTKSLSGGYLKKWKKITLNSSVYFQKSVDVFTIFPFDTGQRISISNNNNETIIVRVQKLEE